MFSRYQEKRVLLIYLKQIDNIELVKNPIPSYGENII